MAIDRGNQNVGGVMAGMSAVVLSMRVRRGGVSGGLAGVLGVVAAGWVWVWFWVGVGIGGAVVVGGCARPPAGLDSPTAAGRMVGIRETTAREDRSRIPELITLLASDDAAVRFAANRSLMRLTGADMGYDPSGDWFEREQAIARWVDWYDREMSVAGSGVGVEGVAGR